MCLNISLWPIFTTGIPFLRQTILKVHALSLHVPAAFTRTSSNLLDFSVSCHLIRTSEPYMRFLSVRSEVCLQLPSDSTSRWTPLLFGYALRRCLRALGTFTR